MGKAFEPMLERLGAAMRARTWRAVLGLVLIVGLPVFGFGMSVLLLKRHIDNEKQHLELLSKTTTLFIEREIEGRFRSIFALKRLVETWPGDVPDIFARTAQAIAAAQPGFIAINLIDADRVIVRTAPGTTSEARAGGRAGESPADLALLERARRSGRPAVSGPVIGTRGAAGISGYFPVALAGRPAGFIGVEIDLDLIVREAERRLDPAMQVSVLAASDRDQPGNDGTLRLQRAISILGQESVIEVALPDSHAHTSVLSLQIGLATVFFTSAGLLLLLADRSRAASDLERQRLKDAIDALPFGFALAGADERLVAVNTGLRDMFPGLRDALVLGTRIEVLARRYSEQNAGDASVEESVERQMARARRGQTDESIRIDENRWHRVIERRTSEGGIAHIQIDISELQRARREAETRAGQLAASEERYLGLVAAIGVITWSIAEGDDGFSVLGGACDALTCFPHPDRLDFNFWLERAHADDRPRLAALFAQAFDEARDIDAQFRIGTADGRLVWLHMKGTVVSTPDGRVKSGLMIDVTAQKEAEIAKASAQAMLASAIESLGDWVALYGPDDRLIFVNAAYTRYSAAFGEIFVPGRRYEDIMRAVVAAGEVLEAKGREEAWLAARFANHRSTTVPTEFRLADGRWFLNRDHRLADGSTIVIGTDITALREATAAADRERRRLRDAIESLPASFLMFDSEERLVIANQRGFDRFALDPSTALGMSAEAMARIVVRQGMIGSGADEEELVNRRLARFRQSAGISEYRSPDGRWWQVIDRPTQDGGRIVMRLDVTETKEARAKLAELHQRFQAILDNAPIGIFMKDRDDRYVLTNRRFDEWYLDGGRTAVGMTTRELRPAQRAVYLEELNRDLLSAGRPIERELDYVGPAKGITHVLLNSFPVRDQRKEVVGIAGFVSDITARRRSEGQREWAEIELRAVMDNAVDGLITIDERGTVGSFSKPAERIFGYRAEEVVGKNVSVLMPEPDASRHDGYLSAYLNGRQPKVLGTGREVTARRRDGTVFQADLAVAEIPSTSGLRRFVGTLRDITARKEIEGRLEQSQRIETLGRLTGGVAHDFNNVLAAIAINLEMLVPALENDPESQVWLQTATRAAFRGKSLTRQLLAVAGQQALRPGRLLVRTAFEEARRLLETSLGSRHHLRVELEDDTLAIHADAGNLESALLNLVLNARDASPDGGDITLAAQAIQVDSEHQAPSPGLLPGPYVRIDVRDTGTGMSPALKARAIEPFFTTKEQGKGSGLGLSMVLGFVRQSGGGATIESEIGLGTVVSLYLPAAASTAGATQGPDATEAPTRATGRTILLAEDEAMIRTTLKEQLTRAGFAVLSAGSADEALALAEKHPHFDLLLSDIKMPGGKTGLMLAQALRALRADLPILLMSGYVGEEHTRSEVARLKLEVLKKPFLNRDLLDAIQKALEGSTC